MVTPVIVVLNEGGDLDFQVARQEVVFEQDAVLQRLMPALERVCCMLWSQSAKLLAT